MEQEAPEKKHVKCNDYKTTEREQIGKYAAESGPTCAVRHFSKLLDRKVSKTTARRLKAEYLAAMKSRAP